MSGVELISTADGSHTLRSKQLGECYHSTNGALQESEHVFISSGFKAVEKDGINILEVGFGSGLNAMLTHIEAERRGKTVYYEAVERYPISVKDAGGLNYSQLLSVDNEKYFLPLHRAQWATSVKLSPFFTLRKEQVDLLSYTPGIASFDLIYFDAFAPDTQPELWSEAIFAKLYEHMAAGAMLLTYSAKGMVKQHLRSVGLKVERLPGAAGKRHMLRAVKI